MRLRVGIVGLGRLGRRHAANLAQRVPRAELVAACSPVADELEWASESLGVERVYGNYDALLADTGVDAVFLVTPTSLHAEQIILALEAGKHVFCEKPLSLDLADCQHVAAQSASHPQLKVMVGYGRRFDPSYRDAYDNPAAAMIAPARLCRCTWSPRKTMPSPMVKKICIWITSDDSPTGMPRLSARNNEPNCPTPMASP